MREIESALYTVSPMERLPVPLLSRLWKTVDRFTLPGLFVFSISLLLTVFHLADLWRPLWGQGYVDVPNTVLTQSVCLVALLAGSALVMMLRSARAFRMVLAAKVVFLELLVVTVQSLGTVELVFVAVLLAEIGLYEVFFINVIVAAVVLGATELVGAVAVVTAASQSLPVTPGRVAEQLLVGQLPELLLLCLPIPLTAALVYYREKSIGQDLRVRQLDAVIERLSATNLGYQTYAHEAASKSEMEERLRISRELHDIVGYTFTNNIMMMEAAITKMNKEPERVRMLIDLARKNAKTGYEKIRQVLYILRASEPQKTPSIERIRKMVKVFQVATQIDVKVNFTNLPSDLEEPVESFFYHFVQESLTNAFLHGAATKIDVKLFRTDRGVSASVADNGVGGTSFQEGIGLKGMRERLEPLGGSLEIRNLGGGFELLVDVPHA